jgi:PhoH-like ATPase
MAKAKITDKRLFVLDTNVLMHDPTSIYRFKEHDLYLPMIVLEEMDANKKGVSETARNVRQVNRFLDELMHNASHEQIVQGLQLPLVVDADNGKKNQHGRLFFQIDELHAQLPSSIPGIKPDNKILAITLALKQKNEYENVTLVSKDINMRIKAGILGIRAEDYYNDRVVDDLKLLPSGIHELPTNFWETLGKQLESWQEHGHSFYKIYGPIIKNWYPNDCLFLDGESPFSAIVRDVKIDYAVIQVAHDYMHAKHSIWGIHARNREQNFALNLLMDPHIDFVSLQGPAGTGKTLLTLAAGLAQTLERNRYHEIIMTRVTVPVGEDIGFLPGTEEEKMTPWMGALMDNLEVLTSSQEGGDWGRAVTNEVIFNRIKIRSLNFMRGRTFLNKYLIIDEAQNLTAKQIKTLVTRAGPGTKIVCLGDLKQIDTPYLSETTSGLAYAIEHFKNWEHSGHITLVRGERSRLADFAAENL